MVPERRACARRFHIVSWMANALGKISRRLWNQARGNGDDEAARRMRGVRYAVLKNPDRLAGRQDESPTALRNTDPAVYVQWF